MYVIFELIIQGRVLCHVFVPVTLGHEFQLLQPGLDAQVRIRLLGLSTSMEHYIRSGGIVALDNAADFTVEINQGKWSDEDLRFGRQVVIRLEWDVNMVSTFRKISAIEKIGWKPCSRINLCVVK